MLTPTERAKLELADTRYKWPGIRDDAIRRTWGMTPAQFWQQVGVILARPDALEQDAALVRRLLRKREARAGVRVGSEAFPGGLVLTSQQTAAGE